jgi:uncharacterized membrane protein
MTMRMIMIPTRMESMSMILLPMVAVVLPTMMQRLRYYLAIGTIIILVVVVVVVVDNAVAMMLAVDEVVEDDEVDVITKRTRRRMEKIYLRMPYRIINP